jgi:hypothetical protein
MSLGAIFSRFKIGDSGRFKDLTSGVQSIVLTIGIVVGAVWTVGKLDLERARADYQHQLAELRDRRVVNVQIKASSIVEPGTKVRHIVAVVQLQNDGRTTEPLPWPLEPLRVTFVPLASPAAVPLPVPARFLQPPGDSLLGLRLMPGIKVQYVFMAPARKPGLYHLRFALIASEREQTQALEEGGEAAMTWRWGNDSYLVVR